jgi:hypothetical protein
LVMERRPSRIRCIGVVGFVGCRRPDEAH